MKTKRQKHEWEFDGVIDGVREEGVPCNRSSLREMIVQKYFDAITDDKDNVEIEPVLKDMKKYHASNPAKLDKKLEKARAKVAALEEEKKKITGE